VSFWTTSLPRKLGCQREYTAGPDSGSAMKKLSEAKCRDSRRNGLPFAKDTANYGTQTVLIQIQNLDLKSEPPPLSATNAFDRYVESWFASFFSSGLRKTSIRTLRAKNWALMIDGPQ